MTLERLQKELDTSKAERQRLIGLYTEQQVALKQIENAATAAEGAIIVLQRLISDFVEEV